jgi:hypothetical protein
MLQGIQGPTLTNPEINQGKNSLTFLILEHVKVFIFSF